MREFPPDCKFTSNSTSPLSSSLESPPPPDPPSSPFVWRFVPSFLSFSRSSFSSFQSEGFTVVPNFPPPLRPDWPRCSLLHSLFFCREREVRLRKDIFSRLASSGVLRKTAPFLATLFSAAPSFPTPACAERPLLARVSPPPPPFPLDRPQHSIMRFGFPLLPPSAGLMMTGNRFQPVLVSSSDALTSGSEFTLPPLNEFLTVSGLHRFFPSAPPRFCDHRRRLLT